MLVLTLMFVPWLLCMWAWADIESPSRVCRAGTAVAILGLAGVLFYRVPPLKAMFDESSASGMVVVLGGHFIAPGALIAGAIAAFWPRASIVALSMVLSIGLTLATLAIAGWLWIIVAAAGTDSNPSMMGAHLETQLPLFGMMAAMCTLAISVLLFIRDRDRRT